MAPTLSQSVLDRMTCGRTGLRAKWPSEELALCIGRAGLRFSVRSGRDNSVGQRGGISSLVASSGMGISLLLTAWPSRTECTQDACDVPIIPHADCPRNLAWVASAWNSPAYRFRGRAIGSGAVWTRAALPNPAPCLFTAFRKETRPPSAIPAGPARLPDSSSRPASVKCPSLFCHTSLASPSGVPARCCEKDVTWQEDYEPGTWRQGSAEGRVGLPVQPNDGESRGSKGRVASTRLGLLPGFYRSRWQR
jgi:hypothetical protein